jgi:hypothetical protein
MAQDLKTQIISYGMKNKKSEREILQAMIDSGQIDIPDAAAAIKSAKEAGVFDYDGTQSSQGVNPNSLGAERRKIFDSISAVKSQLADYRNLYDQYTTDEGGGVQLTGEQAAELRAKKALLEFGVANAVGTGALQAADRAVVEEIIPDPTNWTGAPGMILRGGKKGALLQLDQASKIFDNASNTILGIRQPIAPTATQPGMNTQNGQAMQAPQAQVAPGFQEAMQFAQANPTDPRSVGLKRLIDEGKLDPNTGQRITAQAEQTGTVQPAASPMAPQAPAAPVTPETDTLTSRLWNATKEVIPGLTEDIGNRLKNIWSNTAAGVDANAKGEYNQSVGSTVLQNVGEVAGGIGDAASRVLELAYKTGVTNENQDKVKAAANEFLTTDTGKAAVDALKGGIEAWDGFKQSNPTEAKNMEAVMNILTAIPAGKGLGVAGSAAKEAKNIAGDTVGLAGTALKAGDNGIASTIAKESKDVTRAIKPALSTRRDKRAFSKTLETANQRIIDDGHQPTDLQSYADSLRDSKKKVWGEVETALKSVGDDTKVDLIPIATALRDMAKSPAMLRADPKAAAKVKSLALNLVKNGKKISVQDAEDLKQFINAELSGTFGKFNLSDTEINSKKLVTDLIGKQLDEKLSKVPGEFSNLKSTYGALKQTEDDVLKRLIVHGRQNPESLVDSMAKISGVGNIIESIANVQFGSALKGVAQMAVGKIQKNANDADLIIKKAFEAMHKGKGGFVPKSKTGKAIQSSLSK